MPTVRLPALLGFIALANPLLSQHYIVNTVAGVGRLAYQGDGRDATLIDLFSPERAAFDRSGNLYFTESYYNRVFRVAPDGKLSLFAGNGNAGFTADQGGPATKAAIENLYAITTDAAGNIYFASGNTICKVANGIISVAAGTGDFGMSPDGTDAKAAQLSNASGLAIDAAGAIYFADSDNHVVRKIRTDGKIYTVAGTGTAGFSGDGIDARSAKLNSPEGLAFDSAGNLYIADRFNNRIRRVRAADGIMETFAGNGQTTPGGEGAVAKQSGLFEPSGVAVAPDGSVVIADTSNGRIRSVHGNGLIYTIGTGVPSNSDVTVNVAGDVVAVDFLQHTLWRLPQQTGAPTRIAGTLRTQAIGDNGKASSAAFVDPYGLALDPIGNLYVTDFGDHRVRRINTTQTITTAAGNGIFGATGDKGPATSARIAQPRGAAADAAGNVFFTSACQVRQLKPDNTIDTLAGTLTCGFFGDNGSPQFGQLYFPQGIAVDSSGAIYIADTPNQRIRKVYAGAITTVAGNGQQGYAGNGIDARSAMLNNPAGLAVDSKHNLYIADQDNHRIRRMDSTGRISDFAGTGVAGNDGDGGKALSAKLMFPYGLAIDAQDNVYVSTSSQIRRVTADGVINTIAGNGDFGFNGDGDLSTLAAMDPYGLAVDSSGRVYFADNTNLRVRRLDPAQIYPAGVVNAATFQRGAVAPGEIITVFGDSIGPAVLAQASIDPAGAPVATSLGGVQITFDGVPAPLLYVSAGQSAAIVPAAVAGKTTAVMQVKYSGRLTNSIALPVAPASPGLFTLSANGIGQGAILNQDYTVNSASQPASAGDTIMLFGNGGGLPVSTIGDGGYGSGINNLALPVKVSIGGVDAQNLWAGAAPGMVAGVFQINVQIPDGASAGSAVPVRVTIGGTTSPDGVTMVIR